MEREEQRIGTESTTNKLIFYGMVATRSRGGLSHA